VLFGPYLSNDTASYPSAWYVTIYLTFSCFLTLRIALRLIHFGYSHEKC